MSDLAKRTAKLPPEKRQLIAQKLQKKLLSRQLQKNKEGTTQAQILPQKRETSTFPLSFAQGRLWFIHQLEPQSTVYNIPLTLRLTGGLRVDALDYSLAMIVQRHEVLRTTFTVQAEQPVQIIAASLSIQIAVIDLQGIATERLDHLVVALACTEEQRPFNLTHGPLLRAYLLRLAPQEHIFLFTLHHIITDEWSMDVLLREMTTHYRAYINGDVDWPDKTHSPLPTLPIQYVDYALWQRQWLQGEVLSSQLAYWREQLAGAPALLTLPTDRPRPAVQSYRGAMHARLLASELLQQLKSLSQREGVTLFMMLVAAFQVLLARYSGQHDISVGTPIANRTHEELEGLLGFFINALILRTDLSSNPSFVELLQRVKKVTLGAYAHQDVPFEKLVEVLQPERNVNHSLLFQVMIRLLQREQTTEHLQDLNVRSLDISSVTTTHDLTLVMIDLPQGLLCEVKYSADLFDKPTIERMLLHFETLLSAIVAHPAEPIQMLPLLSPREQEQLLYDWNTPHTVEGPPDVCWMQIFERLAHDQADTIAVQDADGQQVTYEVLNQRANQLARVLQRYGAGIERLVGLCLPRTVRLVEAVLAIAKAGAGLLPLDGSYPQARLRYMLADAQAHLILTDQSLCERLPTESITGRMLLHEALSAEQEKAEATDLALPLHREQVAYVIYTSGSTGLPKGVLVSTRGLLNLAQEQSRLTQVRAGSRLLQFAALSFDAAISELLMSLLNGATLLLGDREHFLLGSGLLKVLQREAITHLTLPPSALSVLPEGSLPHLSTLLVAGEACSAALIERWAQGRRMFNAYGPTEATVCASMAECVADGINPSIGTPLAHVELYILDEQMQPVPIGIPGELYIGGIGLARGYAGRPDLTAESFVPHPFATNSSVSSLGTELVPVQVGARLYRTGDRVRWQADGTLAFLGRLDEQVKLRGYRIELSEIEAVLNQHPGVRECVVVLQGEDEVRRHLKAYVMTHSYNCPPTAEELRGYLREHLPDYMVPASMLFLEAFPLIPNGKIDRKALLVLDSVGTGLAPALRKGTEMVLPQTPLQEQLAVIWAELLDLPQVGIYQNFFALGGHSLLGNQLVARIQAIFQVEIPLSYLFENPTIADMAPAIERIQSGQAQGTAPTGR